jgi:hypothetical protein
VLLLLLASVFFPGRGDVGGAGRKLHVSLIALSYAWKVMHGIVMHKTACGSANAVPSLWHPYNLDNAWLLKYHAPNTKPVFNHNRLVYISNCHSKIIAWSMVSIIAVAAFQAANSTSLAAPGASKAVAWSMASSISAISMKRELDLHELSSVMFEPSDAPIQPADVEPQPPP